MELCYKLLLHNILFHESNLRNKSNQKYNLILFFCDLKTLKVFRKSI